MNRWISFVVCALLGLLMLAGGLLMPIHLRAVDASVIQEAGGKSPALVQHGLDLVREHKLGAARLLSDAAASQNLPDHEKLRLAADTLAAQQPALVLSGGDAGPRIERLFASDPQPPKTALEPLTEFAVRLENREVILQFLQGSANPAVQELLRCRALTNTVIFSPSMSASGQAFDAAISIAGLLIEENRLTPHLRDTLFTMASNANRGANSQLLEQALLDLMSLGQRLNWGQLVAFAGRMEDTETLRLLADQARNESRLPVIFSAVELTGQPAAVAQYLMNFSQTGFSDLGTSLRFGGSGMSELMRRNQRLSQSSNFARQVSAFPPVHPFFQFALDCARWNPRLAMGLKWFFYLFGGFLFAISLHFARPAV
ncbi:MAG: hypothetical protein JWQ04_317, partial [Pedosphaera sp.]|nr:hypothetical protein [Pedosphaera sp.]